MRITKDGIIRGGACEAEHQRRRAREIGGEWLLAEYQRRRCLVLVHVDHRGGKYKVIRRPRFRDRELWGIGRRLGYVKNSGDVEVGVYRAEDVLLSLNGAHRLASIKAKLRKAEAHTSDIGVLFGHRNVMSDGIYKRRKSRGEVTPQ